MERGPLKMRGIRIEKSLKSILSKNSDYEEPEKNFMKRYMCR